jgi:hypothetical protein
VPGRGTDPGSPPACEGLYVNLARRTGLVRPIVGHKRYRATAGGTMVSPLQAQGLHLTGEWREVTEAISGSHL